MIRKFGHIITGVYLILPFITLGQNIDWEQSINSVNGGSAVAVENISAGYVLFGTGNNGQEVQSEWLRLDSLGQLDSARFIFSYDTTIFRSDSKDMVRVKGENKFYIAGNYLRDSNSLVTSVDFISKVDEFGNIIWQNDYSPFAIFQSTNKLLSLQDKSVLSLGYQEQAISQEDVLVRRLDSMGNVMWENLYSIPGNQRGYDLTEMLDGSLVVGGKSNGNNILIKIDLDGRLISDSIYNSINGDIDHLFLSILPHNKIYLNNDSWNGNWYLSQHIEFDENLNITINVNGNDWLRSNFSVLKDSTFYISRTPDLDSMILSKSIQFGVFNSDLLISYQIPRVSIFNHLIIGNDLIISGSEINGSSNYYLAKISGVGEEWIPDRCAYQPPVAGFDYEYNYPVLTLRDTSSGGLKYLDTVYTWQWNTSVGTNGTDDSLMVFFDTAINSSINVELVISNWYGCTDTVNQTLVLGETGLEVYKELEVKVYPNPVKDILNVHVDDVQGDVLFSLYDLQGRLQFNQLLVSKNTTISISELPQGLYIYDLRTNAQVNRGKLIKK